MIRYHVIPHSHWDREWYLSFDEFRGMLVNMIDDLIDILDRDPEYKSFLLDGQTSVLDDYLEVRPERREKIHRLIAAGRLYVGPWYVLPDSFLVSGEALIRNLLRGTKSATEVGAERFVGYIPDSFGHTAQLPQIFRGFGMDCAVFWRGFGGEPGQEGSEYRWTSPDGSWVLAEHLNDQGYSGAYFDSDDADAMWETFDGIRRRLDARTTADARLMLSGGDHHWPVGRLPRAVDEASKRLGEGATAVHSNLIDYFDELKASVELDNVPQVFGEQRYGYRWAYNVTGGVYSARMYIKQANARCQRLLEGYLERLDAVARSRGLPTQSPLIRHAWTTLLQNHPHDSICGCSIDPVHREMETRFEKVENTGRAIERFLWAALTDDVEGVHADDRQVIVFNPSARPRTDLVEFDVEFHLQDVVVGLNPDVVPVPKLPRPAGIRLTDAEGRDVSFEIVEREEGFGISHTRFGYPAQSLVDRFKVRLLAEDVPALGFAAYAVSKTEASPNPQESEPDHVKRVGDAVENEFVRLEVEADGSFWVTDKSSGRRFGPLGILEDSADAGDEYNYSPPPQDATFRSTESPRHEVDYAGGPLRRGITVTGRFQLPDGLTDAADRRSEQLVDNPFQITGWVVPGSPLVSFEAEFDNRSRDHRLRVLFQTGCRTPKHYADSAFCVVEREPWSHDDEGRPFTIEIPAKVASAQRFVLAEDGDRGACLLTDGLPEYEWMPERDGMLALTLLRCVGDLSRGELAMRPGGRAGWYNPTPDAQCPGPHRFRFGFLPYETPWGVKFGPIEAAATTFLEPLRPHVTKRADYPGSTSGLFTLHAEGVTLSSVKNAEDGNDLIIRTYNPTPNPIDGFFVFASSPTAVRSVRLDERSAQDAAMRIGEAGRVADTWEPFAIKTYRVSY